MLESSDWSSCCTCASCCFLKTIEAGSADAAGAADKDTASTAAPSPAHRVTRCVTRCRAASFGDAWRGDTVTKGGSLAMCSDARTRVRTPKVTIRTRSRHCYNRCLARRRPVLRAENGLLWYGRALVQDGRRIVRPAAPVVLGCLALALAPPAAGDPSHDSRTAPPATALARVRATLSSLAAREAALDSASAQATERLRVAHRLLEVARRNLARRLRILYVTQQAEPLEVLLGAASVS